MKSPEIGKTYFFVDESGDPTFFDRRGNLIVGNSGCSPILILGFIETQTPKILRKALSTLQNEIINDPYFAGIPSIKKTAKSFHAKDDTPEVRYLVYKALKQLDFKAHFVVARKIERVFRNNFQAKEARFYDHLVTHLFERVLHRYSNNHIYFAKRGSRDRQQPLSAAIQKGILKFESKYNTNVATNTIVSAQTPIGEPCLSIIDYMNWAVYRAYTRQEMRYYNVIQEKVSLVVDLYDRANYPNNWYNRKNPFSIEKTTPL